MTLSTKVHLILKEGAPWLILTAYMLLPPLYAQEWTCRLQKSALWIFLAISFLLGHVLVAVHYKIMANEKSNPASVLVRPFQASLFGFLSIPFNVLSSFRYSWTPVSAAGIGIGAASVSVYTALWAWGRHRGSIQADACSQNQEDDETLIWRKLEIADRQRRDDHSYELVIPGQYA